MREFRARIIINAAAGDVFTVLTDVDAYPLFDANCKNIEGKFAEGNRIKIVANNGASMRVTITALKPIDFMRWESSWPFNLMTRVRTFKIIAKDDQTTEVQVSEEQSGHLVDVLMRQTPSTNDVLQHVVKGLKKFIEARP